MMSAAHLYYGITDSGKNAPRWLPAKLVLSLQAD
jgi:hypothetical protein